MYGAVLLTTIIAATALLPLPGTFHATQQKREATEPIRQTQPNVVENGKGFIALPFPAPLPIFSSDLAFTPDGSAYFLNQGVSGFEYLLTRVSPNGAYSSISLPRADPNTNSFIFARGNFWMAANPDGVLKVSADGSRVRWFSGYAPDAIVYGSDGAIYFTALIPNPTTGIYSGRIFRIDRKDVVTSMPVPVLPFGAAAVGADGRLYFAYVDATFSKDGIARLESDGTTKLFPIISQNKQPNEARIDSMALSNGKLYFQDRYNAVFGSLAPSGPAVSIPLPDSLSNPEAVHVSADFGGNLWLDIRAAPYAPLVSYIYQFNTYTGRFNGPYSSGYPAYGKFINGGPYVGPDDNIWMKLPVGGNPSTVLNFAYTNALGVVVRHVETLEPASVSISPARPAPFTILETHFNGPWSAVSLSPSVATVSPSSSGTGSFSVNETGPGMTSIAIEDRLKNISYELVTAQ